MAFNTADAFDILFQLDRDDTLDEVPQLQKQKAATWLLVDKLHEQDFAGPLACRASRVLGPISRHRVADVLRRMNKVSRASRPGLLVGFPRILCNGSVLHKDFTLRRTIILAVLDARMNLTPSLTTICVPDCTTSFSLSGDTDGGTRVVDCETLAEWGVISRSLRERIFILFGPVITTVTHLAFLVSKLTPTPLR